MLFRLLSLITCLITCSVLLLRLRTASAQHHYRLSEEKPPLTLVANLTKDLAVGRGNSSSGHDVTYVFLNENAHAGLFALEPVTGIIRTATVLDREVLCPRSVSCLVQLDVGLQPSRHFRVYKITVEITDVNDNAPKFPRPRMATALPESTEPGVLFPIHPADDRDSPSYGVVRYQLVSTSRTFQLDTSTQSADGTIEPRLVLVEYLDREKVDFYQLKVIAYDGGYPHPKSGSILLDVTVIDVNDNNPRFTTDVYRAEVDENQPAIVSLLTVSATDADAGNNGAIHYSFSVKTDSVYAGIFAVDADTGIVSVLRPLDYEYQSSVTLDVIAQDHGDGSIPATARVVINIRDINDNDPEIRMEVEPSSPSDGGMKSPGGDNALKVTEHTPAGRFLAQISVSDPDSGENGQVQCSVRTPVFHLEQMLEGEYKLLTAKVVDREQSDRQRLTVVCGDLGQPPRSTTMSVDVLIDDINDHAPQFSQPVFNFSISENDRPKAWIGRVTATDPDADANGDVRYSLMEDAGDLVDIDPRSGVITAAVGYDRETIDNLQFHVLASDQGDPAMTTKALVNVEIRNVDDEAPEFTQTFYVFYVLENKPSRTPIGRVLAIDRDVPPFNRFTYQLEGGGGGVSGDWEAFDVDPSTGSLYTKRKLDREDQEVMWVTVVARSDTNQERFSVANVTVVVEDANDNAPVVLFPTPANNTVFLITSAQIGHLVTTVIARDADTGENGHLTYEIAATVDQREFAVDAETGKIYISSASVDQLKEGAMFHLLLAVRDGGTPMKQSLADLTVILRKPIVAEEYYGPEHPATRGENEEDSSSSASSTSSSSFASKALIVIGITSGILVIAIVLLIVALSCRWRRKEAKHRDNDNIRPPVLEEIVRADSDVILRNFQGLPGVTGCIQLDDDDDNDQISATNNYLNELSQHQQQQRPQQERIRSWYKNAKQRSADGGTSPSQHHHHHHEDSFYGYKTNSNTYGTYDLTDVDCQICGDRISSGWSTMIPTSDATHEINNIHCSPNIRNHLQLNNRCAAPVIGGERGLGGVGVGVEAGPLMVGRRSVRFREGDLFRPIKDPPSPAFNIGFSSSPTKLQLQKTTSQKIIQ